MIYAKVINGEIVEHNRTLPFSTATTSFGVGATPEMLKEFGYLPIIGSEPMLEDNQRINGVSYVVDTNEVTKVYDVYTMTDEEILAIKSKSIEQAVQSHINAKCVSLGYDNENSIAKYLVEGNQFYEECKSLSLWIGNVWVKTFSIINEVRPIPTIEEILAELPEYA